MVVLVYLEVLGEIVDPPRQQCDLDLRRTGVTLTGRVPGDDLLLDCYVQRHVHSLSSSLIWQGPVTRNPARTAGDAGHQSRYHGAGPASGLPRSRAGAGGRPTTGCRAAAGFR